MKLCKLSATPPLGHKAAKQRPALKFGDVKNNAVKLFKFVARSAGKRKQNIG